MPLILGIFVLIFNEQKEKPMTTAKLPYIHFLALVDEMYSGLITIGESDDSQGGAFYAPIINNKLFDEYQLDYRMYYGSSNQSKIRRAILKNINNELVMEIEGFKIKFFREENETYNYVGNIHLY